MKELTSTYEHTILYAKEEKKLAIKEERQKFKEMKMKCDDT